MSNVAAKLSERADAHGDRVALKLDEVEITFGVEIPEDVTRS